MTDKAPVAFKRAPIVPVVIHGDTYRLAYTFRSIIRVKELTGKSLLSGSVWAEIENDPVLVCAILFAGLLQEHPEIDFEMVQNTLLPSDLGVVLPKIREAWMAVQAPVEDPKIEPTATPALVQ